jgi:DNA-binding MarR family transcriptional regulator
VAGAAEQHDTLVDEVIDLLVRVNGRMSRHFAVCAAAFDLAPGEAKVLLAVDPGRAEPMRAIARRLGLDPSNFTGIVDRLEERGLVVRSTDRTDRRVKAVAVSDQGLALRTSLADRLRQGPGPLGNLGVPELREMRALLSRVVEER